MLLVVTSPYWVLLLVAWYRDSHGLIPEQDRSHWYSDPSHSGAYLNDVNDVGTGTTSREAVDGVWVYTHEDRGGWLSGYEKTIEVTTGDRVGFFEDDRPSSWNGGIEDRPNKL